MDNICNFYRAQVDNSVTEVKAWQTECQHDRKDFYKRKWEFWRLFIKIYSLFCGIWCMTYLVTLFNEFIPRSFGTKQLAFIILNFWWFTKGHKLRSFTIFDFTKIICVRFNKEIFTKIRINIHFLYHSIQIFILYISIKEQQKIIWSFVGVIISNLFHLLLYSTLAATYFIVIFSLLFQVISIFNIFRGVCTSNACQEAPFICKLYHNYLSGIQSLVKGFFHTVALTFPLFGLQNRMLNRLNACLSLQMLWRVSCITFTWLQSKHACRWFLIVFCRTIIFRSIFFATFTPFIRFHQVFCLRFIIFIWV